MVFELSFHEHVDIVPIALRTILAFIPLPTAFLLSRTDSALLPIFAGESDVPFLAKPYAPPFLAQKVREMPDLPRTKECQ
jgi:hypothetical protein